MHGPARQQSGGAATQCPTTVLQTKAATRHPQLKHRFIHNSLSIEHPQLRDHPRKAQIIRVFLHSEQQSRAKVHTAHIIITQLNSAQTHASAQTRRLVLAHQSALHTPFLRQQQQQQCRFFKLASRIIPAMA
jgi:hypothetical protein